MALRSNKAEDMVPWLTCEKCVLILASVSSWPWFFFLAGGGMGMWYSIQLGWTSHLEDGWYVWCWVGQVSMWQRENYYAVRLRGENCLITKMTADTLGESLVTRWTRVQVLLPGPFWNAYQGLDSCSYVGVDLGCSVCRLGSNDWG